MDEKDEVENKEKERGGMKKGEKMRMITKTEQGAAFAGSHHHHGDGWRRKRKW